VLTFSPDGTYIQTIAGQSAKLWRVDAFEKRDSTPALDESPSIALESWLVRTALRFDAAGNLRPRYQMSTK